MKLKGAKKQTFFLTIVNAAVRAIGLCMRVLLSRLLGAEAMGIAEMAQSIHMLAIAPLTSGLPVAITRLTALADRSKQHFPLLAGLSLVRIISFLLIPLVWILSPWIAQLMGDVRVLPSLWFTAPCILVLGYSASYNGFCYGTNQITKPAASELLEQITRFFLTLILLGSLSGLTLPWLAAIPVFSTFIAEIIGLIFVIAALRIPPVEANLLRPWKKEIIKLAVPSTITRLLQTIIRSATAILIPIRLQKSGLPPSEATALLGMYNGMVSPILMLPCIFTSALAMVTMPKFARAEENPAELKRLLLLSMGTSIPAAALCAILIFASSSLLALHVYRVAELVPLFRLGAPLVVLYALTHISGSVLSALGEQNRAMYASVLVSLITLGTTWMMCANPEWRIHGVVAAQYLGQLLSFFSSCIIFFLWRKERHPL